MAKDTPATDDLVIDEPKPEDLGAEVVIEATEPAKAAPAKVLEPADALETLKTKLAEETAARQSADSARQTAEQDAARSKNEVQDTNVQLVTNAIAQMKQATEGLKGRYAEAMTNGDYGAAADVQAEMAEVAAKRQTLENGLEQLKAQPKATPRPATGPVEQMASSIAASGAPRSAEWLRAHPQYATDERLTRRMIAAANLAETDGYRIDSDEYFAAVEKTLGIRTDAPDESALSEAARPTQHRVSPSAAPVSRGANGNGSAPTTVRLSAEEREMASMMGLTDVEYAKNKIALQKEGRIVN